MTEVSPGRHAHIKKLFLAACERPGDERSGLLDTECHGDAELRREVERLLRFQVPATDGPAAIAEGLLDAEDFASIMGTALREAVLAPSERIGSYRLLKLRGAGGMGEVWEAERDTGDPGRVALKLIRAGVQGRKVVARFDAERRALARMDHANIATVLDAGSTREGLPYFVMELVEGLSITAYCERRHLTTRERVTLLVQVCEAVQHAHTRGIIHRDLKPSNILVEHVDGGPVSKVIDFGVAKALRGRLTEKTLFTTNGVLIGTPDYMSPEQAALAAADVDARSDVYSLGVILYELLVGVLPFTWAPGEKTLDEMLRQVLLDPPLKPSVRVGELDEPDSRRRPTRTASREELRGGLDRITMKALAKKREDRYGSAVALADDLRRYLRNERVRAGDVEPSRVRELGDQASRLLRRALGRC